MVSMQISHDVEALIKQFEEKYPRVAANIRLMWSHEPDCEQFFVELLHYKADYDRQGFDVPTLMILGDIQKIYMEQLNAFRLRKMTPKQRENYRPNDVWGSAYAPAAPKKSRNPFLSD
jgi:hypothetical protein